MSAIALKNVTLDSGVQLPYAESGRPDGIPVVFVHGPGETWRSFQPVLGMLPPTLHGFAPTQRGHGDASKPADGYRPADYAADLVAFLDALGIERAVLAGGGSGGVAARIVAGGHPHRVAGLVLLGTPASLDGKEWAAEARRVTDRLGEPDGPDPAELLPEDAADGAGPEWFATAMAEDARATPPHVWRETMDGLLDSEVGTTLGGILVPTLALRGDQDERVTPDDQARITDTVPAARLDVLEGAGHAVHWEQPASVVGRLAEFAEAVTRRAA
ncbi:alpha/beta fold hydrolase [Streptomyces bohaiensis]|uniref:Alpha/beta fold hydrolase n=1 Tax=Streptomyces bohaiensis TaxID=1431344 RepID=A0ABX1CHV9_9ACTN|nr:alpha/beta fold hydrolase [Streptomyces bohaiensis]NJQ16809.1 alpha/beta fold hydrolase [Streptomyces bohaiensis]